MLLIKHKSHPTPKVRPTIGGPEIPILSVAGYEKELQRPIGIPSPHTKRGALVQPQSSDAARLRGKPQRHTPQRHYKHRHGLPGGLRQIYRENDFARKTVGDIVMALSVTCDINPSRLAELFAEHTEFENHYITEDSFVAVLGVFDDVGSNMARKVVDSLETQLAGAKVRLGEFERAKMEAERETQTLRRKVAELEQQLEHQGREMTLLTHPRNAVEEEFERITTLQTSEQLDVVRDEICRIQSTATGAIRDEADQLQSILHESRRREEIMMGLTKAERHGEAIASLRLWSHESTDEALQKSERHIESILAASRRNERVARHRIDACDAAERAGGEAASKASIHVYTLKCQEQEAANMMGIQGSSRRRSSISNFAARRAVAVEELDIAERKAKAAKCEGRLQRDLLVDHRNTSELLVELLKTVSTARRSIHTSMRNRDMRTELVSSLVRRFHRRVHTAAANGLGVDNLPIPLLCVLLPSPKGAAVLRETPINELQSKWFGHGVTLYFLDAEDLTVGQGYSVDNPKDLLGQISPVILLTLGLLEEALRCGHRVCLPLPIILAEDPTRVAQVIAIMRRVALHALPTDVARTRLCQGVEQVVDKSHQNLSDKDEAALMEEIKPLFNDSLASLAEFVTEHGADHGLLRVIDIDGTVAFVAEKSLRRWQLAASKHLDHGALLFDSSIAWVRPDNVFTPRAFALRSLSQ